MLATVALDREFPTVATAPSRRILEDRGAIQTSIFIGAMPARSSTELPVHVHFEDLGGINKAIRDAKSVLWGAKWMRKFGQKSRPRGWRVMGLKVEETYYGRMDRSCFRAESRPFTGSVLIDKTADLIRRALRAPGARSVNKGTWVLTNAAGDRCAMQS
jgi:hypothetical protein